MLFVFVFAELVSHPLTKESKFTPSSVKVLKDNTIQPAVKVLKDNTIQPATLDPIGTIIVSKNQKPRSHRIRLDQKDLAPVDTPTTVIPSVSTTAKTGILGTLATFGLWGLLRKFARVEAGILLNRVLQEFPNFNRWLHEATGEKVSNEVHYKRLMQEFNAYVHETPAIANNLVVKELEFPIFKQWIATTDKGTEYAMASFMNTYKAQMVQASKKKALAKWDALAQHLNVDESKMADLVTAHMNYKNKFLEGKIPRNKMLNENILNKVIAKVETQKPTTIQKIQGNMVHFPKIAVIAGSVIGAALLTTLVLKKLFKKPNMAKEKVTTSTPM